MDCHKCKKPMTMTPVCSNCGSIPIAEASFKQLESDKAELTIALQAFNNHAYSDEQLEQLAECRTGMGEIGPYQARCLIQLRNVLIRTKGR